MPSSFGRRLRKTAIRRYLFGETQTFGLVLIGGLIYLLLFLGLGGQQLLSRRSPAGQFPRKIWQSWKNDALSFETRDSERSRSWLLKNPSFRHEVLTDTSSEAYVGEVFGPHGFNRPDIVETFKAINARIIQADLLRYIIMYAEGGVWADVDTEALHAFDRFVPEQYTEEGLKMIIGVETDEPDFKNHPVLGSKAQSFCQWVFVCKPQQPIILRLIDGILAWLKGLAAKQGREISQISFSFDDVLSGTGPSAFTAAVLAEMSKTTGTPVTWEDFHGLTESKSVGGILVHPAEAFAAGTGHSHSGRHDGAGALVKHHFHASEWTKSYVRFKHPIYGEVERCNWDPICVKIWDANTAFFDALPNEDQLRIVGLKSLDDAKALASKAQIEASIPAADDQTPEEDSGDDAPADNAEEGSSEVRELQDAPVDNEEQNQITRDEAK
jgi:mannosyltransferase OCH1-like enzyme